MYKIELAPTLFLCIMHSHLPLSFTISTLLQRVIIFVCFFGIYGSLFMVANLLVGFWFW